jgi:hypothetical protein
MIGLPVASQQHDAAPLLLTLLAGRRANPSLQLRSLAIRDLQRLGGCPHDVDSTHKFINRKDKSETLH